MKRLPALFLIVFAPLAVLANEPVRFEPVDILIDTGGAALAAWQIEVSYDKTKVAITGLEGGERAPFPPSRPPRHDRRGLAAGRIILADFTTDKTEPPEGRFRIARLHLQITGDADPDLTLRLIAAAQPGGKAIDAVLSTDLPKEGAS